MTKREPFRISHSITDFSPLFFDLEYLFKRLKATGIDGVEIVLGVKSRWNAKQLSKVSQKYGVPVVSLHQPPWAGAGVWFDEEFVKLAEIFGVKQITCHPLLGLSFDHPRMLQYFQRLAHIQEKYDVEILLENQTREVFGVQVDTYNIEKLIERVKKYNFRITLDVDHLRLKEPHKEPWFPKVLPYLGNIHLSSFTEGHKHMPLNLGDFKAKEFLEALHQADYQGLITFEFQYPRLVTFFRYDFELVRKSVEIVKSA